MNHFDVPFDNLTDWQRQQIQWVASLSDDEVLNWLSKIMRGYNYSWFSISQTLQSQIDSGALILEDFEPGNIPYEWNVLCDERVIWNRYGRPSFKSFRFNRVCLANLRIIPSRAGLGPVAGSLLATTNTDVLFYFSRLTVEPEKAANQSFRGSDGLFYAEGPEFRVEYIHDRVED